MNPFAALRLLLTFLLVPMLFMGCGGSGSGGHVVTPVPVDDTPAEYLPGETAPQTTSPEMKSAASPDGTATTLILDDTTRAFIPELEGSYEATLERANPDAVFAGLLDELRDMTALAPTGSVRRLTVTGEGEPSRLKPVITIPSHEAGTVNPETLNVLRVGDVYVDGELVQNHAMMLPVSVGDDGHLSFVDPLMVDATMLVAQGSATPVGVHTSSANPVYEWIASADYMLTTLQDDLNWSERPRLVRMIPDSSASAYRTGYRRQATPADLDELARQPICNVMLLVHGHNEEEKEGSYSSPSEDSPWWFSYKRLVWDLLYQVVQSEQQQQAVYPHECTAFYEFIYPTYHPIFSEVPDKSGRRHETLGEALGLAVQRELVNNAQLQAMIQEDMPFNVIVVAHSQGGLVARAGFRHMPEEFLQNVVRFVSWGSPHHGAALYTLRYAFQSGHDMILDDVRFPLQNIRNNMITGPILKGQLNVHVALDAPGIRDLRWDASKKDMLNTRTLFDGITDSTEALIRPALYSEELATFNGGINQEIGGMQGFPYTLIYGTTDKTAELDLVDVRGGWWWQYRAKQLYGFADSTSIEQGAALNALMTKEPYKPNDGAVPVYSQQAQGVVVPTVIEMPDIDHEEFYGAEPDQRNDATIYKGVLTAETTFEEAELRHPSRSCPLVEAEIDLLNDQVVITGQMVFPLYATTSGTLGQRIEHVEARVGTQAGAVVGSLAFVHQDDGSFRGEGAASSVPAGEIAVVAVLKDGSEADAVVTYVPVDDPDPSPIDVPTWDCGWSVDYSGLTKISSEDRDYYVDDNNRRFGADIHWYFDQAAWQRTEQMRTAACSYDSISHGNRKQWYSNGEMLWEGHYIHGKLQGVLNTGFDNGQLNKQWNYDDGVLNGPYLEWFSNGVLRHQGQYTDGVKTGTWYEWGTEGQCRTILHYGDDGTVIGQTPCSV